MRPRAIKRSALRPAVRQRLPDLGLGQGADGARDEAVAEVAVRIER